ncbi:MAG: OmpH family outer membrane protein [Bacteroidetes bacterium]|nr:MAG: OmpH family outer membrane protein [Bacteroidota bacterium]
MFYICRLIDKKISMKNLFLALALVFGTSFVTLSQKYAYIDSDYILENVPEYQEAKSKLDKLVERWTKEMDDRYAELKKKKEDFAREEVLLLDDERKKREEDIARLESEAMQMQQVRFGVSGDYFQKRQELIKPIQDKVFEAMQKVASSKKYMFVFDKANQSNLVYADSKYDISDDVLREMGQNPK